MFTAQRPELISNLKGDIGTFSEFRKQKNQIARRCAASFSALILARVSWYFQAHGLSVNRSTIFGGNFDPSISGSSTAIT